MKSEVIDYVFHLATDLISYVGAFFLLRCFYVMYLPTVKNGKDVLARKTNFYLVLIFFFMVVDFVVTINNKEFGIFITEFLCGVVNAVVLIFLFARFENKLLDTPWWILLLLYIYAVLQTCLPFVTENFLAKGLEGELSNDKGFVGELIRFLTVNLPVKKHSDFREFLGKFNSIVLTFCLVGKVALSAVLLYVLKSKRIVYYFMTLKKIHEEEEDNWGQFKDRIRDFSEDPKTYRVVFERLKGGKYYHAKIPDLFEEVIGEGSTPKEAQDNLLERIRGPKES